MAGRRPSHPRPSLGGGDGGRGCDRGRCHPAGRPGPRRPRERGVPAAAASSPPGRPAAAAQLRRLTVVRRGVLFMGVMTGTCLVVLAYSDGFHPALPAVPHLIGVTLAAVLVWLVMAAVVTWLAELLRRHHHALAAGGWRHGKRGTIAAARMAGKGGRSATSRLTS